MAQIITVARGMGSGGRTIAKMLSEDLNYKYYDKDLIKLASEESGINEAFFGRVDEKLKGAFLRKNGVYKGQLLKPDDPGFVSDKNLFNFQAKVIKELAEREAAIIVGRCADYILKGKDELIRIFIYCDMETAVKNVIDMYGISEKEAKKVIERTDKQRSDYYSYYTGNNWENARNYDICLDTSRMSYDTCVEIIKNYINTVTK